MILGPKHTFKFFLGLDFLRSGSANGEHGLMVMLMDRQPRLEKEKQHLCKWACLRINGPCNSECYSRIHMFKLISKWITPAEFMYHLNRILREHARNGQAITRLVFSDLIQLESRFPFLAADELFIPTMLTNLKY